MSRILLSRTVTVAIVIAVGAAVQAQDRRSAPRGSVEIREIKFRSVATPDFKDTTNDAANSLYSWLQVFVEYETSGGQKGADDKEWLDEVELDWAILINSQKGKPLLLKQRVTYIDVAEGKHRATVYIRPGLIRRYTGMKRPDKNHFAAYLEIRANGQKAARQEFSRGRTPKGWWEAREPDVKILDNELLPRDKTPFSALDYDFYEHIKNNSK